MPDICVYTTNHPIWLRHMRHRCSSDQHVCFQSKVRWASARKHLSRADTLPLLFRELTDDDAPLCCTYIAELVELRFPVDFSDDSERRRWLETNLWLQRERIQEAPEDKFADWQEQFKVWEMDHAMRAETLYVVRNLRPIEPLPITRLIKVSNGEPLASNYIRSYSICYLPREVEDLGGVGAHAPPA